MEVDGGGPIRMTARSFAGFVAFALAAAGCAAAGHRRSDAGPLPMAAESFDAAWQVINDTHFDTTFNGVDWAGVRRELRPRAVAARDADELRGVIGEMLGRLRQSHFLVIPEGVVDRRGDSVVSDLGTVGVTLRMLDDQIIVERVDAGGVAQRNGVRPGWGVRSIGAYAVRDSVRALLRSARNRPPWLTPDVLVAARLYGPVGSAVRIELDSGRGTPVARTLTRERQRGTPVKFGDMPVFVTSFESERTPGTVAAPSIGVLRFNYWMPAMVSELDRAIDSLRDVDGIVIDLRGNGGGFAAAISGVAGHFFREKNALGTMKLRQGETKLVANPRLVSADGRRVEPYAGPVAILVDRLSASASEVFAGGMQALGRARVFGETSFGGVLPATTTRLPNGDVLYHAFAEFITANGGHLEGRGVIPDERIVPTRAALLAGEDPVFDGAVRWIGQQQARATSKNFERQRQYPENR
jgi:carboxyl-terminal processing protease